MSKNRKNNSDHLFNMEVGLRIALGREMRKMTQETLAKHLTISRCQMTNIEAGRSAITLRQAITISRALKLPLKRFTPNFTLDGLK